MGYILTNRNMEITVTCLHCKKDFKVMVVRKDYRGWKCYHRLAQESFPYLSKDERELLISGICGLCFDIITKE